MTKTLGSFIEKVAYLVVLVVALSMMFRMVSSLSETVRGHRSIIFEKADGAVLPGHDAFSDVMIVSYGEVISMLLDGIEYDVLIENTFIHADLFEPSEFDYFGIEPFSYRKKIYYGSDGNVSYVSFEAIR